LKEMLFVETPIKLLLWLFHSCLSYMLLQGYFKETSTEYLLQFSVLSTGNK
jgi:hypothetical protein